MTSDLNESPQGKAMGSIKATVFLLVIPACRESGCSLHKEDSGQAGMTGVQNSSSASSIILKTISQKLSNSHDEK